MKLLRQRAQRFGQQSQLVHLDRQFAGFGFEYRAFRAEDIAQIPALKILVQPFRQGVLLDEQLNIAGHVAQSGEAGLAHDPFGQHPPGDSDPSGLGVQFNVVLVAISGVQFRRQGIAAKVGGIGIATLAQLAQLLPAQGDQFVFVEGFFGGIHRFLTKLCCRRQKAKHQSQFSSENQEPKPIFPSSRQRCKNA